LSAIGKSHWASNARALARRRRRKAVTREAGLIGVEGKGRMAKAHDTAHRHGGGVWAIDLKIPLLH